MEEQYCQVCHFNAIAEDVPKLMDIWGKHVDTDKHMQNFLMYLMLDIGAETIEEIPEKMDQFIMENQPHD